MPEPTGEAHRVLFVDGIWLSRDLVVLIALNLGDDVGDPGRLNLPHSR